MREQAGERADRTDSELTSERVGGQESERADLKRTCGLEGGRIWQAADDQATTEGADKSAGG